MERLWQDLRFGARMLIKNPGMTAVAVLVLAMGIGANTAMFSLVNAFLLRPLAVQNPEELVTLHSRNTKRPDWRAFSYPNYVDLRERNTVFSSLMAHNLAMVGLEEGDNTRRVFADIVSQNYFEMFGVRPFRGRPFSLAEERPGSNIPVVIVSYQHWKKTGRDPDLVGKTLRVNGRPFTVIGIMPEEFTGVMAMMSPEISLPLGVYESVINDLFAGGKRSLADRNNHCLFLVGRLKPDMTAAKAGTEMALLASQLERAYPAENREQTIVLSPLSRMSVSTSPSSNKDLTTTAILITAMASVVLLIACLNLANMLLARCTARRKEFAIRLSLGAGGGRILRQLLTEGLLLSLVGGAAGLLLAGWGTSLLVNSMQALLPLEIVFHSGPDPRVLAAMFGFCLLSTLMFGFGPAWKLSRSEIISDLKQHASEDKTGSRRQRFFAPRNILVLAQMSLSLVLLAAAGLFVRSALEAARIDPGFNLDNAILVELDPSLAGYSDARGRELYRLVMERLRSLPGVESAGLAQTVPFGMISMGRDVHKAEELNTPDDKSGSVKSFGVRTNVVSADYFRSMGLRILRGRDFNPGEAETGSAAPAAVVDEILVKRLYPGEDPLGRRIYLGKPEPGEKPKILEIVGVVTSLRERLTEHEPEPHVFTPFAQGYQPNMNIHLRIADRGRESEATLLNTIRRELRAIDERLPILALKTLRGHFEGCIDLWIVRTGARLFTIFGALALFLSVVGVYGVKAYTVARRTHEIGIRMALGATASNVQWLVLSEGLAMTGVGVAMGLTLAAGVGRLLSSMLYGVNPWDPVIFSTTPAVLAVATLLACYIPAQRAARVDPMVALREE